MSEIYPSVRTSIRNSVLHALYERPGAWLSTHDLLALVEEAESSDVLARILSDMAATGRLAKGAKTQNAKGQACNTWGLSPEWRGRLAVENTWQDHTGQETAERQTPLVSLTPPAASLGTEPQPLPVESSEDEAPAIVQKPSRPPPAFHFNNICDAIRNGDDLGDSFYAGMTPDDWEKFLYIRELLRQPLAEDDHRLPASGAAPDPAPAFTLWADASAAVAAALPFISGATSKTTPSIQETEIICAHLPERWLPDLRLRLLGYDDRDDPVITLRVSTEGGGAYLTLSTHGQIAFDPGELDFLPSLGTALCQFVDALYPYGTTRPAAAATTPSAPDQA